LARRRTPPHRRAVPDGEHHARPRRRRGGCRGGHPGRRRCGGEPRLDTSPGGVGAAGRSPPRGCGRPLVRSLPFRPCRRARTGGGAALHDVRAGAFPCGIGGGSAARREAVPSVAAGGGDVVHPGGGGGKCRRSKGSLPRCRACFPVALRRCASISLPPTAMARRRVRTRDVPTVTPITPRTPCGTGPTARPEDPVPV